MSCTCNNTQGTETYGSLFDKYKADIAPVFVKYGGGALAVTPENAALLASQKGVDFLVDLGDALNRNNPISSAIGGLDLGGIITSAVGAAAGIAGGAMTLAAANKNAKAAASTAESTAAKPITPTYGSMPTMTTIAYVEPEFGEKKYLGLTKMQLGLVGAAIVVVVAFFFFNKK